MSFLQTSIEGISLLGNGFGLGLQPLLLNPERPHIAAGIAVVDVLVSIFMF